ncbi:hypothetical protein KFE25_007173 [Diacronema lutheri]|uniref:MICOS complex subunit MIC60 n=1 Tax=Diacronema lutheri TaxID=2081491 RepID=A0A8J5XSG1_DIALT|nr:hypothetical protein KFE25_007173 [Diacronema lutheri]
MAWQRAARLARSAAGVALPVGALFGGGALLTLAHAEPAAARDPALLETGTRQLVDALKERLSAASAELEALRGRAAVAAQADADAARVQAAVQRQEEEDSLKLLRLLQAQEKVWEAVAADKLGEQADHLAVQHAQAARALTAELEQLREHALAQQAEELNADCAARLDVLRQNEAAEHEQARLAESSERLGRLAELRAQVEALDRAYSYDAEYKSRSHGVHRLTAALFALEEALGGRSTDAPLGVRLGALRAAAPADEVIEAALASLPAAVLAADRVPTCRELQLRFESVASHGRIASYVPEGSGIAGQLIGALVAFLAFQERGLVPPVDAAAVISRAHYYVAREQLQPAVQELQTLRGLPRTVTSDWVEAASQRVALEQAVTLVRAHVTTLACALA